MSILQLRDPNTGNFIPIPCLIGPKGDKGDTGEQGPKPVKGTDYFTEADKQEIAEQAAQMVEVPTKLSELEEDSDHRTVTASNIYSWSNKSEFSGDYNDLINKPTIPSRLSELTNDGVFITKDDVTFSSSFRVAIIEDEDGVPHSTQSPSEIYEAYAGMRYVHAIYANDLVLNFMGASIDEDYAIFATNIGTDFLMCTILSDKTVDIQIVTNVTEESLQESINTALAQAKDSGEFDGATGPRGTCLIAVTTTPSAYTTEVNGLTPAYRISLSTVKSQGGVTEVKVGDVIQRSYYHYPVIYVDASYAYCRARVSIRGAAGAAGTTPVKGTDYFTDADKTELVGQVKSSLPTLTITGVDENDVAHTWLVYGVSQ